MKKPGIRLMALVLALLVAAPPGPGAQAPPPASQPPAGGQPAAKYRPEELEALVSPIALYPDALLAQVFMASTYPLEVVQAARFAKENAKLQGDQLNQALKQQTWDDSVKSLVSFPQVLNMMNEKLDWTQRLGDAFLASQKDVMGAVQRLRAKAQAAGNLKTTAEQKVIVEPAPAPQTVVVQQPAPPPQIIKVEQTNPQVVYVPTYNPAVVYGAWPYPAYPPPPPYYPPGYVAGAAALSFTAGMVTGAALWGNCNWNAGTANVNVSNYQNYSKTVNNTNTANQRISQVQGGAQGGGQGNWQHNPENRKGVAYRDQATAERFGKGGAQQGAVASRDAFRGRQEAGRQQLGQGGQGDRGGPGGQGLGDRGGPGGQQGLGDRGGVGDRGGPGGQGPGDRGGLGDRGPGGGAGAGQLGGRSPGGGQGSGGGRGGGAFQGMDSGRAAQSQSQRGQQSMGQRGGGQAASRPSGGGRGRR